MDKVSQHKEIVASGLTALGSLTGYFIAQKQGKENVLPYTIVGGFIGTVLATVIAR